MQPVQCVQGRALVPKYSMRARDYVDLTLEPCGGLGTVGLVA